MRDVPYLLAFDEDTLRDLVLRRAEPPGHPRVASLLDEVLLIGGVGVETERAQQRKPDERAQSAELSDDSHPRVGRGGAEKADRRHHAQSAIRLWRLAGGRQYATLQGDDDPEKQKREPVIAPSPERQAATQEQERAGDGAEHGMVGHVVARVGVSPAVEHEEVNPDVVDERRPVGRRGDVSKHAHLLRAVEK